mmetsp:Transcript_15006/g.32691  ORF Transcript_15006/g.32691 Transcript_15006/m.32691 type:complete len:157 (-) Transcript_15006:17-487(-)
MVRQVSAPVAATVPLARPIPTIRGSFTRRVRRPAALDAALPIVGAKRRGWSMDGSEDWRWARCLRSDLKFVWSRLLPDVASRALPAAIPQFNSEDFVSKIATAAAVMAAKQERPRTCSPPRRSGASYYSTAQTSRYHRGEAESGEAYRCEAATSYM